MSFENSVYLKDKMSRMPEAINRLAFALLFQDIPKGEITKEDINSGLSKVVSDRRNEPEIYLSGFTAAQQKVIVNIAKMETVRQPRERSLSKATINAGVSLPWRIVGSARHIIRGNFNPKKDTVKRRYIVERK
jgi:hypothetical protein